MYLRDWIMRQRTSKREGERARKRERERDDYMFNCVAFQKKLTNIRFRSPCLLNMLVWNKCLQFKHCFKQTHIYIQSVFVRLSCG